MPTQDNCDDLQVDSCVDENGQTINGGDSYEVPTGRYVKHVVNVCGSGGSGATSDALETTACPDGGLEETWSGADKMCLSIKTEADSALVLDGGVLKIDSTKIKVTSDNVLPAGTDPGLLSTVPAFMDPDGNVWNNQSDYNVWIWEGQTRQDDELKRVEEEFEKDQERQDDELERVEQESKARDLVLELEILYLLQHNQECNVSVNNTFIPSGPPFSSGEMFSAYDNVIQCTSKLIDGIKPEAGRVLRVSGNHYNTTQEWSSVITNVGDAQGIGSGWNIYDITLEDTAPTWLTDALGGSIFQIASCVTSDFVTKEKFEEDQQRQDEEIADLRKEVCPKITCEAVRIADKAEEGVDQIAIQYFNAPGAPGHDIFTGVLVISDNPPDVNKKWININGVRYEAKDSRNVSNMGPQWDLEATYGDLEYLVGTEVTVDNCDTYVRTSGDTMTGDLIVDAKVHADVVDTTVIDSGENSNLQLKHDGTTKVYVGREQVTVTNPLKLNTEGTDDDHAVTKKYIDDTKEFLQNEIIELEEEIEAIAPSVERGKWAFTAVGTVANQGQFTMYDAEFGSGSPTGLFKSAKSIWFNEIDSEGTPHAFADVDDGELLEIFIDGSPEYGLYEVVGQAHDETDGASSFWVIDVNFVRTLETTTAVGPGELCRFKIFRAPSGGDASGFVLKSGDKMTGNLVIDRSGESTNTAAGLQIKGNRGSTNNSAATVTFQNEQSNDPGYLTYRSYADQSWFGFNQDVDLSNNGLHSVARIRMQSDGYIGIGSNERIKVRNGAGSDNQAGIEIQRVGDGKRAFAIRGKEAGSSSVKDIFWAYGGGGGDALFYTGLTTNDYHIATKKYVDDQSSAVFKPDDDWNRNSKMDFSGDRIVWSRNDFPRNDGEIVMYDLNGSKMSESGKTENVAKIQFYRPGGAGEWKAGHMGLITFGQDIYNSNPKVIFQVYALDKSDVYWSWHVRQIWPQSGVMGMSLRDLDGVTMSLRHGAAYKNV